MNLAQQIRANFEQRTDTVRVAPGRINLIGEHTDYSLLPVLPMAIDRSVEVRAALRDQPWFRIDSERMPDPIELTGEESLDELDGWHRYVWAGLRVAGFESGADVLISGDLPSEGGLSSSSALTVALLAALHDLAGSDVSSDRLVAQAVEAERLTGVAGGTMDQNVIVRAVADHALRIDFAPFSVEPVPIPSDLMVVAAYSGTVAPKGGSAKALYNDGVAAGEVAATMLADMLGVDVDHPPTLSQVAGVEGVGDAVAALPNAASPTEKGGNALLVRATAEHVLGEALRVDAAQEALVENDLASLGRILTESHHSLRSFGASTPALDALTTAMTDAGAAGARLTGAGFGGYAVAVCRPELLDAVLAAAHSVTGGCPAFRVRPSMGVT